MAILLNGAGGSAADPILKGLGLTWVFGASTMDISTLTNAWIDTNNTFPGTNSVTGQLSPATTVVTAGNSGSIDSGGILTISSTTGLSVGDYIYVSHGSITAGLYEIATIPDGTTLTFVSNPFGAAQTGVSYQVGWRTTTLVAGTSPSSSSGGGTQNYYKVRASDSAANQTDAVQDNYIRDAPSGSSYISIDSKSYTGQTTNDTTPSFSLLSGWTNNGGVSHVAFAAHSVQTGNTDFRHSDGTTGEKTLSTTETNGLNFTAGDGQKYGRILLKSKAGGVSVGVDLDMIVDTGGPTITMILVGR